MGFESTTCDQVGTHCKSRRDTPDAIRQHSAIFQGFFTIKLIKQPMKGNFKRDM